jgi:hypothetical protein
MELILNFAFSVSIWEILKYLGKYAYKRYQAKKARR